MRATLILFALYAAVVVTGMVFVATDSLTASDAVLFLTSFTGVAAFAIGFTLARR